MEAGIQHNNNELAEQLAELRLQLEEAQETIEAIRTGQIDALVVQVEDGHRLYTLESADIAYRVFIEKMSEGAITINLKGVILYCNSQFAAIARLPLSNIIGLPFEQFIAKDFISTYQQIISSSWHHESKIEVALQIEGKKIPVQLSLAALQLEGDNVLSILVTDLSQQKETQLQLAHQNEKLASINHALELSNHDLQQFASVASHDLQEPLRKIQVFSNLLQETEKHNLSAESQNYLDKIINAANRMKALVLDVLDYSKLSDRQNSFLEVDLNSIVAGILDDFDFLIQEKQAVIMLNELPRLQANFGQMRQVFQNLISNALKFSRTDQQLLIEIKSIRIAEKSFDSQSRTDGQFNLISIKDNGIGFDESYVNNIFNLFSRLHSKHDYEGTGIGLAITKKIIEKHNGLITARSSEGNGAEFLMILPYCQ